MNANIIIPSHKIIYFFSDSFSLSTPLDDFKIFKLQKSDSREDKQNERLEELKTRGVREGTGSLY